MLLELLVVGDIIAGAALFAFIGVNKYLADSLQQLDAIISGLGTEVTQLITDVNALIAAVQALPGQDFTNEVNAIQADITNLTNLDTTVTAETQQLGQNQSGVKKA